MLSPSAEWKARFGRSDRRGSYGPRNRLLRRMRQLVAVSISLVAIGGAQLSNHHHYHLGDVPSWLTFLAASGALGVAASVYLRDRAERRRAHVARVSAWKAGTGGQLG